MIKKQILVDTRQDIIRLYAGENPCAKCPSGCSSAHSAPPRDLQAIDFVWPSTHLNSMVLYLFGLPLALLCLAIGLIDTFGAQSSIWLLGLFVAAAVGVGMLLGRHLAYKKSRSLLIALKEAIAIPTMPNSENAYAEKSA